MDYRYSIFETDWGYFGLFGTDKAVLRSCLPTPAPELTRKKLLAGLDRANICQGGFDSVEKLVTDYYKGTYVDFSVVAADLHHLPAFTKDILTTCRTITYGQKASYAQLADLAQHPAASRAAGTALAKNPIPLIIPCHRIVRSDGRIGQFSAAGGQKTKQKMLELETR